MRTARLPTVCVSVATIRCQYHGVGGVCPQVNKFQQVSNDDHQMSDGGRSPVVMSSEGGGGIRFPGLMLFDLEEYLPCDLSHDACDVPTPSPHSFEQDR